MVKRPDNDPRKMSSVLKNKVSSLFKAGGQSLAGLTSPTSITLNQYQLGDGLWMISYGGVSIGNFGSNCVNIYDGEGVFFNDGNTYTLNGQKLTVCDPTTYSADNPPPITTDWVYLWQGQMDADGQIIYIAFYPDTTTTCVSQNVQVSQIFHNPPNPSGTIQLNIAPPGPPPEAKKTFTVTIAGHPDNSINGTKTYSGTTMKMDIGSNNSLSWSNGAFSLNGGDPKTGTHAAIKL